MATFSTVEDARRIAKRRLPRLAYDFIAGGSEDEVTLRANRRGFEELTLRPRFLYDVADRDQSVELLGNPLSVPVVIAPTGMARLAGRGGDAAGAGAAGRAGTIFTLSTMSSYSIEEVARAASGPLWFQLYLWRSPDVVASLVKRAHDAGYQGLVVTLDVPVISKRERDVRNGFTLPPRFLRPSVAFDTLRHPRWVREMFPPITFRNFADAGITTPGSTVAYATWVDRELTNAGATLDDLRRLRESWDRSLLVKGTLTAEDAERMLECGVDGIVVSNHGGRQLDGAPAAIDALPEIAAAVGDRVELILDGGVRRGTDVLKAIALGAKACMVGRPWLYGLAAGGEDGVHRVLEIFREEIDRNLALVGRRTPGELEPEAVGRVLHRSLAPAGSDT